MVGSAEENLRLLEVMDANRRFMIAALLSNPDLLARAEPRLREWLASPADKHAATSPELQEKR